MLCGTCESSSLCDDDEVENEDDRQAGAAEGAHMRRDRAWRHCKRISCSRSAARAAMRGYGVVLLKLAGTRVRQGGDVRWFKMADANKEGFLLSLQICGTPRTA